MWAFFNRFTLEMTKKQALSCSHPGPCDNDVEVLLKAKKIRQQLDKISDYDLRSELKEWGAWSDEELTNRQKNEQRIVWIAACNIKDDIDQLPVKLGHSYK